MWVVTSFFNPVRHQRRLTNYRTFRARLDAPLITVELSFDGQFELTQSDADILVQISGGAVLWQKERLLNRALESIPSGVEEIAWIDCDVLFDRSDWIQEAKAQLRHNNVVQLFSDMLDLGPEELALSPTHAAVAASSPGIVHLYDLAGDEAFVIPAKHPSLRPISRGLAWAGRRALLATHGLYDACIIGSGDRSMAFAMYGQFDDVMRSLAMNDIRQKHYLRWAVPFHRSIAGRVGYVPGRVYHLWHGDIKSRNYTSRHQLLSKYSFDPNLDIKVGKSGAWEWARPKLELAHFLEQFFKSRAEDGVTPNGRNSQE